MAKNISRLSAEHQRKVAIGCGRIKTSLGMDWGYDEIHSACALEHTKASFETKARESLI